MAVSTLWVGGWVSVWWGGGACARVRARAVPAAGPCLDARRTTPLVYRTATASVRQESVRLPSTEDDASEESVSQVSADVMNY